MPNHLTIQDKTQQLCNIDVHLLYGYTTQKPQIGEYFYNHTTNPTQLPILSTDLLNYTFNLVPEAVICGNTFKN
jgi:hypothetical protein